MDQNENNVSDTDQFKKEASATFNDVKETIKNVDFKRDAEETKNFLIELFRNPVNAVRGVANSKGELFIVSLILLVVWTLGAIIIDGVILNGFRARGGVSMLGAILTPIASVLTLSGLTFMMSKVKKSLTVIIATITMAFVPVIVSDLARVFWAITPTMSDITMPISGFLMLISVVLMFFALKALFSEEDSNKFVRTFFVIYAIYYVLVFITSIIGLSILSSVFNGNDITGMIHSLRNIVRLF